MHLTIYGPQKDDEIQSFADRKDMKFFYALNNLWSPELSNHPALCADGTSLQADTEAILKRWANTLILSLIGHHLSMMKLSIDNQ